MCQIWIAGVGGEVVIRALDVRRDAGNLVETRCAAPFPAKTYLNLPDWV
jgi:hypothetical protein